MKMEDGVEVLGFKVLDKPLDVKVDQRSNTKILINTINAYSYVLTKNDPEFCNSLNSCDILLPDGFSIVLAAKVLYGKKIKKIAGENLFYYLIEQLNASRGKVFFLGSSEQTLKLINAKLNQEYPRIQVGMYSPPYKKQFSDQDNQAMIEAVNHFSPDVLFVGMTAPKQEKWVAEHCDKIDASIIGSIGAVFDFYAGTVNRPSNFWVRLNLEWFIRFLKEPIRLWKRYFVHTPIFFLDLLKVLITTNVGKKKTH